MVSPQGSILAGIRSPQPDFAGALAGGMEFAQQRQMRDQQMQMNDQNMALAGRGMDIREQQMGMQQQQHDQQTGLVDYEVAVQKIRVANRLAKHARSLPEYERGAFVQSLNPDMLKSVGINPEGVSAIQLDDRSLDGLIAQTGSVLSEVGGDQNIQQAQYVPGLGYVQQRRDGSVGLQPLSADEQRVVRGAMDQESDRRAREAAGREGAVLGVRTEMEPTLTDLNTRAKDSASQSVKQIGEYSNQLANIEANIGNYNEGVRLLEQGADTGVITSRLPTIRATSQKLNNLRNRLGLDVVGSTTFGALSQSELDMALDTGMPDKLPPEELKKWFIERRNAQHKLAGSISSAIQFLNIPGNSLADLHALQKQDKEQQAQPQNAPVPGQQSIDDLLRMY